MDPCQRQAGERIPPLAPNESVETTRSKRKAPNKNKKPPPREKKKKNK